VHDDIRDRIIIEFVEVFGQLDSPIADRAGAFECNVAFIPEVKLENTAVILASAHRDSRDRDVDRAEPRIGFIRKFEVVVAHHGGVPSELMSNEPQHAVVHLLGGKARRGACEEAGGRHRSRDRRGPRAPCRRRRIISRRGRPPAWSPRGSNPREWPQASQAFSRAQPRSFWGFCRATFEDPFRLRRHQAPSPPKPRSGGIASGVDPGMGSTGPYLGTATVTLHSPRKSTPFCDEN
jgi:hypothetical protein